MLYRITVPKVEKTFLVNSMKIGLMSALCELNKSNKRINLIVDADTMCDVLHSENCVALYTQYGDLIAVDRVRSEVAK